MKTFFKILLVIKLQITVKMQQADVVFKCKRSVVSVRSAGFYLDNLQTIIKNDN